MIATNQKKNREKIPMKENTTRKIIKDNLSTMAIPSLMFPFYIDYFNFKNVYLQSKE